MEQSPGTASEPPSKDQRNWALAAHLAALAGLAVPFGNVLGPLVVWAIKKDAMPYVAEQGKEALNFQLTMLIAFLVCGALTIILIGFVLLWVVALFDLVMIIIAAVQAGDGKPYRYPFTWRLIR